MSGIKDLRDIYEQRGAEKLKNLLSGRVFITEKLDAHRFVFEKNNGQLRFFKKNSSQPLSVIDRTISDLYEKAINYIESLPTIVKNNIPENLRFGFAYFPNNKPLHIEYKKIHSSKLILTDIIFTNENNKIKKTCEDIDFLNRWAKIFRVGEIPLIYQGNLNEAAIEVLLSLANNDERIGAFFSQNISNILGNTYTQNHIIEGIVIRTEGGLMQLKDPSYDIFESAHKPQESRDFYDLTLLQIESFIKNKFQFPQSFTEISSDGKYIELINAMYNSYIENNKIDENLEPTFLRPKIIGNHGKLSRKFIRNQKTIEYLNRAQIYEELYKVFLSSFRKKRKAYGLLTENFVNSFNQIIDDIQKITKYNPIFENIDSQEDTNIEEFQKKLDSFKVISSIQTAFNHEKKEVKRGETPIVIMVGDFNPLNADHLRHIEKQIEEKNKIILCHIVKNKLGESKKNFKMSDELVTKILGRFATDNSENVVGYMTIPFGSIAKIFSSCRKINYEPLKLLVEEGTGPSYLAQLYLEDQVLGNRVGATENFKVLEFRNTKSYDVLRSLEDANFKKFVESTPLTIHGFWDAIISEYRKWAGMYP